MSRWWKCDLQVATPGAPQFRGPSDPPWNIENPAQRLSAAQRYTERLNEVGVEVVAIADHNDASWIEPMAEAGRDAGITVFPGMELTTGSGSDGIHVLIIGDLGKGVADFEALLSGVCGFGQDHPRFNPATGDPASSPRTLMQILDELPDGFLAIAPHAFNDNGIASEETVRGDLRWKALHHDRLAAIDVGDLRTLTNEASFHYRFAHRLLEHFPCLGQLAFVSTSDAYDLEHLGPRWTWIRMSSPTFEGLRQAFLDFEARIVCDWDPRYRGDASPNDVNHAWVETVQLDGLSTSSSPIEITLDPRLNVLIGGRGSGKSTIVAGLRCLYSDDESLPPQAAGEMRELLANVFASSTVRGSHHLPHSGEHQTATWNGRDGSITHRVGGDDDDGAAGESTPTDFKVRVINQKELFERASHSSADPHTTSRNLLRLVDDALATGSGAPGSPAAFDAELNEAQTVWISAARAHQSEVEATAQQNVVAARVGELERQVAAFDSPENKARREQNDRRLAERDAFDTAIRDLRDVLNFFEDELRERLRDKEPLLERSGELASDADFRELNNALADVGVDLRTGVAESLNDARRRLDELAHQRAAGPWQAAVEVAASDAASYRTELAELGIDPAEYEGVRSQLAAQRELLEDLNNRLARLPDLAAEVETAWSRVEELLDRRRVEREELLAGIAERSGLLRFSLLPRADVGAWTTGVRELLNLRADGFLLDVPALGSWLWGGPADQRQTRLALWREACVTGDFDELTTQTSLRPQWIDRLSGLDGVLRTRLGAEVAEDVVQMDFLLEGGDPTSESDWQALTAGSPGQRSAAMLSFVLHHGVEPLILDQPEDDLDTEWITELVVRQLRASRWTRQLLVVTHNANIPVNADAERVIVLETHARGIRVRESTESDGSIVRHVGALEDLRVREDVQQIMEGGVAAFVRREQRYNNELNSYRAAMQALSTRS